MKKETLARKGILLEGDIFGDGGLIYRVRATVLLGWLAGMEIARKIKHPEYTVDASLIDLIRDQKKMIYFGEYATIYYTLMAFYAELSGDESLCKGMLANVLGALAMANSGRRKDLRPLPDPYWRPESIIENCYGITDPRDSTDEIDFESFKGCSFTVMSLIDALARRGERAPIEAVWHDLSHLQHAHYTPKPKWETYLWRSERGTETNTAFPMTGSWANLRRDSLAKPQALPPFLESRPWFIPVFLLTFPHRTNPDLLKLVDPTYRNGN